ncbi:hypothetical protein SAPIO_CDS9677 [Scedosporium apiospermum]|uniref:DUF7689 domain-containing protein n=1 Tax=Pseudallescheria apiosperma TaxID=563466 RepID=A0A084FXA9_PSEDA|nr:uncharacterized protein SAPIO_CDS9677 [Scedosporium apiospermum]KEZ39721.1 hypothetical protein SAPIO_CDS9677 [Scedosporium apiospermum]
MANQQLTQFVQGIIQDHSDAREGSFAVHWETSSPAYNCFAFAVGDDTRWLTPMNLLDLEWMYAQYGYFRVAEGSPQVNDVEVYARGGMPLHAHKISSALPGDRQCDSKMGQGPIISHSRGMLQSPMRHRSTERRYGTIVARYRYNKQKQKEWQEEHLTKTSRGRTILKHGAAATGSGAIIHVGDLGRTKSGRIVRKPTRYGAPIAKKGETVPVTREDGGNGGEAVGGD